MSSRGYRLIAPVVAVAGSVMLLAGPTSPASLLVLLLSVLALTARGPDRRYHWAIASWNGPPLPRQRRDDSSPHLLLSHAETNPSGSGSGDPTTPANDEEHGDDGVPGDISDDEMEEISFLPAYLLSAEEDEESESTAQLDDWILGVPGEGEGFESAAAGPPEALGSVPIPRHFALGTVAIIRKLLEPAEVAQILLEQRSQPKLRFGELGVQLGLLTESQVTALLLTQRQGLFTDDEIREARIRLKIHGELEASTL